MRKLCFIPRRAARVTTALLMLTIGTPVYAETAVDPEEGTGIDWVFTRELPEAPRGGTTTGPQVTRDTSVPESWKRLQQPGITPRQRDRRAILALQGEFKVAFEFIETFAIDPQTKLDQPYSSWATEYVSVVEQRDDFISLQHLMVMFFEDPESGETIGPHVMKHWRQDWTWQPSTMWEYSGDDTWASTSLTKDESAGQWLWEVYQVDDSPRYSGLGQWDHFDSVSTFSTGYMSRPLPRREHSVRDDYDVLTGQETLVLTPTAWYHEQRNFKQVDRPEGNEDEGGNEGEGTDAPRAGAFLSREIGHNSYERIKDFDFEAGHDYWQDTADYWRDVRAVWRDIFRERPSFGLKKMADGKPLYARHFEQADDEKITSASQAERRQLIRKTIEAYLI